MSKTSVWKTTKHYQKKLKKGEKEREVIYYVHGLKKFCAAVNSPQCCL